MPEPDEQIRKSTREKLIDDAQVSCHNARSDVVEARLTLDGVPRNIRKGMQQAVVSYYYALRPLRTEGVVKSWWESVELSEDWIDSVVFATDSGEQVSFSAEKAQEVLSRGNSNISLVGVSIHEGLDTLETLDEATEETTEVISGMRGRREETRTRPLVLSSEVLIDISGVLDEAATKLGFAPSIDLQDAEADVI